jgi:hypothetical protein
VVRLSSTARTFRPWPGKAQANVRNFAAKFNTSKQATQGRHGLGLLFEFAEFFYDRGGAALAVQAGQTLLFRRYRDHVEQRSRL